MSLGPGRESLPGKRPPLDAIIFALDTDDRSLLVFADAAQAIAHCEGIDVQDGGWEFWGAAGEALEAVFSEPSVWRGVWVSQGVYSLRASANRPDLRASLARVERLEPNPRFDSLASVHRYLA